MKAYKGFNKDLTCRDFQYEEGKEYETSRAECCETGFHACEYPLDVFSYYSPNKSVFHEVEIDGSIDKSRDGDKICGTKIRIGARLDISGLVKAAIDFTMARIKPEASSSEEFGASSATGDYGASSATGDYGASSATGYKGASSATGDYGASSATGTCGASSATGDYGASSATGYKGASSATGDYGASSATGYKGASSATGYKGASSATGTCGASSATGYKGASDASDSTAVAVAWGHEAKAKGCKGAHLVLSDWRYIGETYSDGEYKDPFNKDLWVLQGAKLVVVDGENIKEDTYYRCINGEIVEVSEDGTPVEKA